MLVYVHVCAYIYIYISSISLSLSIYIYISLYIYIYTHAYTYIYIYIDKMSRRTVGRQIWSRGENYQKPRGPSYTTRRELVAKQHARTTPAKCPLQSGPSAFRSRSSSSADSLMSVSFRTPQSSMSQ